MPKLTGSETSNLVHFATFRNSENVREYYDSVIGSFSPEAKKLADVILGYIALEGNTPEERNVLATAKYFVEGANRLKEESVASHRYAEIKHRHKEELKQFYRSLDDKVKKCLP